MIPLLFFYFGIGEDVLYLAAAMETGGGDAVAGGTVAYEEGLSLQGVFAE